MQDANLKKLKKRASAGFLQGDEFDAFGFNPNIYQRIFFMEERTVKQARVTLEWLWENLRSKGYAEENREPIAVVAYPLTDDAQNWELFADVPAAMADAAVKHSATLIDRLDTLDRAITSLTDHPSSYVLPNRMLVERDLFSDWFWLFHTSSEVQAAGRKRKKLNVHIPA